MNNMDKYGCEDVIARMGEYLDGETDPETSAAIEEHISSCERCRRELDELKDMRRLIKESDVTPPAGLHDRIMMSVRAEATVSRRRRFVRRFGTVAAALVLVVGIAWVSLSLGVSLLFRAGSAAPEMNDAYNGVADMDMSAVGNDYSGGNACEAPLPAEDGEVDERNDANTFGAPGASAPMSVYEICFEEYGHGYDGGYVICAEEADAVGQLAKWFEAEFDGTAFVIPYSEDAMGKVTSLLGADGIGYSSEHVGGDSGEQCIIVSV